MSIERVRRIFNSNINPRFTFLFGQGVEDVLINHRLQELKFEEALYEELKRQGYDRIAFFSPHQSLFFLDEVSLDLSRPGFQSSNSDNGSNPEMEAGPLSGINLLNQLPPEKNNITNLSKGMGDNHAIRLIDTMIRQNNSYRTAVVFLQAETIFRYFEDQRTLSSLVGDWNKLSSSNRNRCFFVFPFLDRSQLIEFANQIQIPELRTEVNRQESLPSDDSTLVKICGPDIDEVRRIIFLSKKRFNLFINETDFNKLCNLISAEDLPARIWVTRLEHIQGQQLDLDNARSAGWFISTTNPDISVWERLDQLVGLGSVKLRVKEIAAWLKVAQQRGELKAQSLDQPTLHMIFTGNPGTGKTTVARLFGEIFHELGILKKGHLIEVHANDLVADHVGATALKTNAIVDRALGGVLFIDEAYALVESDRGGFGQEAIDTLLTRLENERHHLVVIAAGYPIKMEKFRQSNPGLSRRFPVENVINFEDFSVEELWKIFLEGIKQKDLIFVDDVENRMYDIIKEMHRRKDSNFGNAGEIRNMIEGIDRKRASRLGSNDRDNSPEILIEDIPQSYSRYVPESVSGASQEFFKNLDNFVGLTQVKVRLRELAIRTEFENTRYKLNKVIYSRPPLQHLIFMGNPGTGKTTIARMVGQFYKSLGLLSRGHCIEVSRSDLVAGYVGQTAIRTTEKVTSALDGILFIDEAHTLVGKSDNDFGNEAINTLVKMMEDNRERLVVIAAGYPQEMESFLVTNPGLKSRFSEPILFDDYSVEELVRIFSYYLANEHYLYTEETLSRVKEYFVAIQNRESLSFRNARAVLQLIDEIKSRLAQRVLPLITNLSEEQTRNLLNTILPEDVPHPGFYLGQVPPNNRLNTWASATPKF